MSLLVEIEKQLGNFHLNVRFQAETETLALLGASGCGKSMTLKCIAGIMTPDRGRIVLNGRVLFDSEARIDLPPQQRRVGYLFQNYALFPTMTVERNILCGIRSGSKAEKNAALPATLHHFRLEVPFSLIVFHPFIMCPPLLRRPNAHTVQRPENQFIRSFSLYMIFHIGARLSPFSG